LIRNYEELELYINYRRRIKNNNNLYIEFDNTVEELRKIKRRRNKKKNEIK